MLVVLGVLLVQRLFPMRYMDEIERYAQTYDLPVELVCAVIHTESRFRSEVQSAAGAVGLMQIMQITADWGAVELAVPDYRFDRMVEPALNIQIGCWYLRRLIDQYGVEETALAAYNAGSGNVSNWLAEARYSADGRNLNEIPFGETARYVEKVARNRQIYRILLAVRERLPQSLGSI